MGPDHRLRFPWPSPTKIPSLSLVIATGNNAHVKQSAPKSAALTGGLRSRIGRMLSQGQVAGRTGLRSNVVRQENKVRIDPRSPTPTGSRTTRIRSSPELTV